MSKHRQQNKAHQTNQTNRVGTSMSIGPEAPNQIQEQTGASPELGFVPTYEDVQRRAYQIHEEKGGSDLENWLEAERVLKAEQQVKHL